LTQTANNFFATLPEPQQSALLFLQQFLKTEMELEEAWKNNTPFYYTKKKWFAFISYNPKDHEIYISFVKGGQIDHAKLVSEGRKQMKIYYINPEKDINTKELSRIVSQLKKLY
jgi:hypothetical protein